MDATNLLRINVNIDITGQSLEAIVANAKQITGKDAKGRYQVDTAEVVNKIVSKFLIKNDFESFAKDINNYERV